MTDAGWIVASLLCAAILFAIVLRTPLLAMFDLELANRKRRRLSQQETRAIIQRLRSETQAMKDDRSRVEALLALSELEVSDVMVHRTNMRSINADNAPDMIVREVLQSPHTRLPLWKGALDNIVGILHAKDLLRALTEADHDFSRIDILKIAAKPWIVPDTTSLDDQLNAFLRRKAHIAIVVDEYGEVEGLVTLAVS